MVPQQSPSLFLGVIQILTSWKVDVVCAIFNLICECVSATLEQVAKDRLMYIWVGFACALAAVGFAVGEVLWMKQNKIRIGFLDLVGFLAAILQILSFGIQVV
ncbi:hypothetical protein RHGRI_015982 [Rhododendron griersonianum]|uniref:Uncharacterized protein n=1 Tax=Rhododendron griersonianum TaxID=479676 RepID=A0AAV6JST5_9ERIC|nr:hypothetical protein RHGRI_015982 [Rhododendron griersonianum]